MQAVPKCSIEDCDTYVGWNCGEDMGKLCDQHYNDLSDVIKVSCRSMNIQQFKHKKLKKSYCKKSSKKSSKKTLKKSL